MSHKRQVLSKQFSGYVWPTSAAFQCVMLYPNSLCETYLGGNNRFNTYFCNVMSRPKDVVALGLVVGKQEVVGFVFCFF